MRRLALDTHTFIRRTARWGLVPVSHDNLRASRIERRWRWPTLLVLAATIPAFYAELLQTSPSSLATLAYLLAASAVGLALLHVARHTDDSVGHVLRNPTDLLLLAGLVLAAWLPSSTESNSALALRLGVAILTLVRMVWALHHLITRGSLAYLMLFAMLVLAGCGLGFWWLEPTAHTLADGLWLAFTTAATVGYGDMVPTTHASKIFSVFVVLLGYGVLSLVTAAIATSWIETEDRRMERDIMRDVHREIASLRQDLHALRTDLLAERSRIEPAASGPPSSPTSTHQGNH